MRNAVSWFELPVEDFDRAKKFYEAVLAIEMRVMDLNRLKMALFPTGSREAVGGALCYSPAFYRPGPTGALLYLNAEPDLAVPLSRVEAAGGKILVEKRQISPEHGHMAVFLDTEGNQVALHSAS